MNMASAFDALLNDLVYHIRQHLMSVCVISKIIDTLADIYFVLEVSTNVFDYKNINSKKSIPLEKKENHCHMMFMMWHMTLEMGD